LTPDTGFFAVVKADAYGHGAVALAGELVRSGLVTGFAVSMVEEGLELRYGGVRGPILVMGPSLRGGYEEILTHDLTPLISDPADLEALADVGRRRKKPVVCHLKIDTGMGRLGILPKEVLPLLDAHQDRGVQVTGLATHFACADTDDPANEAAQTLEQNRLFAATVTPLRQRLGAIAVHAANSAAILRFPATHWTAVRPGIALYGSVPYPDLRPAMQFSTRVAQIRWLPAGATVGYGATFRARVASRVAVLHAGYADGVPRLGSGRAQVLIGGRRVPLVGTISRDMAIADVTALGDAVRVGDEAVFFGVQGSERIQISEVARWTGLIEYEVTCGISRRVPRHYIYA
jgi:alanine racemase